MHSEIPLPLAVDDWPISTLDELSDFITKGTTPTTLGYDWVDEGVLFLRSECVSESGFRLKGSQRIPPEAQTEMSRSVIRGGDVLVTITGNVGRVCRFPMALAEANINQHIARVRIADLARADPDFVTQVLGTSEYRRYFERIITGLAYPQISLKQVRNTPVALPPLPEQRKIAAILSSLDAVIEKTEAVIEQLQVVKKAMMRELLTRGLPGRHTRFKQTEIGEIPEEWEVVTLGDLLLELRSGASLRPSDFEASGIPVLHKGDVGAGGRATILDHSSRYTSPAFAAKKPKSMIDQSFLVATLRDLVRSGPSIGLIASLNDDRNFVLAQGAYGLRVDSMKLDGRFLTFLSNSPWYRKAINQIAVGSTQIHIRASEFRGFRLPVPPIEEQKRIGHAIYTAENYESECRAEASRLSSVKTALMSVLLTGEVRVNAQGG